MAGAFEMAHGGTLFLDELGEMSLRMQAVLLRFTETGEIQPVGADTSGGRVDGKPLTMPDARDPDVGALLPALAREGGRRLSGAPGGDRRALRRQRPLRSVDV